MKVIQKGNPDKPLLVCVHGLMGHVSDFEPFVPAWEEHFNILIPDYAPNSMDRYYVEEFEGEEWLMYDLGGRRIADYLKQNYPGQKAYFAGISVGGKVSIEIAGKYPEVFAGAVVTDVGVGSLTKSNLCQFLEVVLPSINVKQPWSQLRLELRDKIKDRMLRILVQSHIEYKDKSVPEGNWKDQGYKFFDMLKKSRMEDQWDLAKNFQAPVVILKSEFMSAIADKDYEKQLKNPHLYSIEVPDAGHFIQITHHNQFQGHVKDCLLKMSEGQPPC